MAKKIRSEDSNKIIQLEGNQTSDVQIEEHIKKNVITTKKGQSLKEEMKREYQETLYRLQVELVKFQREMIEKQERVLIIFEGRDAGGKDGTIKRIAEHLSPRETRIVALGKPSDRDITSWYFQRYVAHLPAASELVLFNRSWYNRAGVERVMDFCTDKEYEEFMNTVPLFEQMLVQSGIRVLKYYLDISKKEQKKRLKERRLDPLKQWKWSPIDEQSVKHWKDYSEARNAMFARTHHVLAPWYVVQADDKRVARIHIMKHILSQFTYPDKDLELTLNQSDIVFAYDEVHVQDGTIVR